MQTQSAASGAFFARFAALAVAAANGCIAVLVGGTAVGISLKTPVSSAKKVCRSLIIPNF